MADAADRSEASSSSDRGQEGASSAPPQPPIDIDEVYQSVRNRPLRVNKVLLTGYKRTRPYVIERELTRNLQQARSLDEIKDALLVAWEDLMHLDVFETVAIAIDQGDPGRADSCNVAIHVVEKPRLNLHAGTYVQANEGSVEFSVGLTNPLGFAERISLSAEWGSQSSNEYAVALTHPRLLGTRLAGSLSLLQQWRSFEKVASFGEQLRGGSVSVTSEDGRHTLAYDLAWRRLVPTKTASRAVAHQAGNTLKSALKYVFRYDTFDDATLPKRGFGIMSSSEVAGLGGDPNLLRYAKQQVHLAAAAPLGATGATAVLGLDAGALAPWGPGWRARPTGLSDRFLLGGAGSLRGFRTHCVGPTDLRRLPSQAERSQDAVPDRGEALPWDYLGGDAYVSVLAALRAPLPWRSLRDMGLQAQLFANGGSIMALGGAQAPASPRAAARQLADTFRWSVGFGVLWPLPIGNLEVNFARILRKQPHDTARHGIHVGFVPRHW